jgi:hypothetical protein
MGIEEPAHSPGNLSLSENGGAESGADSADLARIIDVWPTLPDDLKAAILALIDRHAG